MIATDFTLAPYVILRAQNKLRGESLNAGVVLFAPTGPLVGLTSDWARIKALHPDFGPLNVKDWAQQTQDAISEWMFRAPDLNVGDHILALPLLTQPFVADTGMGATRVDPGNPSASLEQLLRALIDTPTKTLKALARPKKEQVTKLNRELRQWLTSAKAFSKDIGDLSKNRVVANYPISPAEDLYADLALKNGVLHFMEALDLRGIDKLSPSKRGEAAVKGIILDEAKQQGNAIAIVCANDYGLAKPAISMISRYANELYDLGQVSERDRLAQFIAKSLHKPDLLTRDLLAH